MTCVHKENEVKNGAGAMNTAKKKFSLGYNIKSGIQWAKLTFGSRGIRSWFRGVCQGGIFPGGEDVSKFPATGKSPHPPSREN